MDVTGNNGATAPTVSIRDVARAAGVSHQTVSRVLNNHPNVSRQAHERVSGAIAALGYRPNRAARALASGHEHAVTVLTSDTSLFGYAGTLAGIEEAARAQGVRVGIRVLESDRVEDVAAAVEQVSDPRMGAVIVLAYDLAGARAVRALPGGVRSSVAAEYALARQAAPSDHGRWTWFDDIAAAENATRHLLGLGHRTVHHMAIPSSAAVGDRERGWRRALAAAGAPVPEVVHPWSWTTAAAHESARALLGDPEVTAILCGNDDQALGVLRAAHDLGVRIPADVSVVGFDDTPGSAYYVPALTTIRFDFTAMGRRAFATLGIGRDEFTDPDPLPEPTLIIRESTGPAAIRPANTRPT